MFKSLLLQRFMILALLLALLGCSNEPRVGLKPGEEAVLEKANFSFTPDRTLFDEYRIAPGDQLDILFTIKTWEKQHAFRFNLGDSIEIKFPHIPELDEVQKIRPDGYITLPYIGEVQVAGKTIAELTQTIKSRYKPILRTLELTISSPDFLQQIRELKKDLRTAPRGLSRLVTVRPDGFTTFPMLGDVTVAGRTMKDVSNDLNSRYKNINTSLYVDLFLEKHSGALIYILGEVIAPGSYNISRPVSLLEAMAMAGSYKPDAQLDSVVVVRRHEKKLVATVVDMNRALHLQAESKYFYLQPDDIVFVPQTRISEKAQVMRNVMDVLMFRGWGISFDMDLYRDPLFGPGYPWDNR